MISIKLKKRIFLKYSGNQSKKRLFLVAVPIVKFHRFYPGSVQCLIGMFDLSEIHMGQKAKLIHPLSVNKKEYLLIQYKVLRSDIIKHLYRKGQCEQLVQDKQLE